MHTRMLRAGLWWGLTAAAPINPTEQSLAWCEPGTESTASPAPAEQSAVGGNSGFAQGILLRSSRGGGHHADTSHVSWVRPVCAELLFPCRQQTEPQKLPCTPEAVGMWEESRGGNNSPFCRAGSPKAKSCQNQQTKSTAPTSPGVRQNEPGWEGTCDRPHPETPRMTWLRLTTLLPSC